MEKKIIINNSFMGSEPPKYLVIHQMFFYEILFTLSRLRDFNIKPFLKKNKGDSQKNHKKNFVKKRITKYFGGSDPMNELKVYLLLPFYGKVDFLISNMC